ncbi:dickkopf-related protein 4-like [Mugil cephalus]|uniref:dickkopf-related protein 4-like n=1 Tax=Mugil cephalus TaxID=48193 RepID=UPI001FB807BC|nr:dickkopf-related protein 4-like [Mugil cephalus]
MDARMRTWMCPGVLYMSLLCVLALDSNTIRSKETTLQRPEAPVQEETSYAPRCPAADCSAPTRGGCSNRARRPSSPRQRDDHSFNRTRAAEMSGCVRSGDCGAGLCCVRYLTGKRCQRIPTEGQACLLRGPSKVRRNLGRCDCDAGLSCTKEPGRSKGGQGVCLPRSRRGQRKTRHSGKKRRTAERSC